jgi:hypothetical protein
MGALSRRKWFVVAAALAIPTLLVCCNLNPQPLPPDEGASAPSGNDAAVNQPGNGTSSGGDFGGGSSGSTVGPSNDAGAGLGELDAAVPSEAGTDASVVVTDAGVDSGTVDGGGSDASVTDGSSTTDASTTDASATDGSAMDASPDAAGDSFDP